MYSHNLTISSSYINLFMIVLFHNALVDIHKNGILGNLSHLISSFTSKNIFLAYIYYNITK